MCCLDKFLTQILCCAIFVVCSVLLIMATFETSEFGPRNNRINLRLTSLTFTNLSISANQETLTTTWTAGFVVNANKTGLTIMVTPFYVFLTFQDQILTNGIKDDILYLGNHTGSPSSRHKHGLAFHVAHDPRHYFEPMFMMSRHKRDFVKELERNKVRMGMNVMCEAYYRHWLWSWELRLMPYCKEIIVARKGAGQPWYLENPVDCFVPLDIQGYI